MPLSGVGENGLPLDESCGVHPHKFVDTFREDLSISTVGAIAADVRPLQTTGGPDDITLHTLRHSVAYRIIQVDGGPLEDVQLRLRHAQPTDDRSNLQLPDPPVIRPGIPTNLHGKINRAVLRMETTRGRRDHVNGSQIESTVVR